MLSLREARQYTFDCKAELVLSTGMGAVFALPTLGDELGRAMYLVAKAGCTTHNSGACDDEGNPIGRGDGQPFYTDDLLLARTTVGELSLFPLLTN